MQASIAYHTGCQQRLFRVAGSQLSLHAVTTLPTRPAVGTQLVFSDPRDRSMWEIALIVAVMTPTNHPRAHWPSASLVTVTPAVNGIRSGVQYQPVGCGGRVTLHHYAKMPHPSQRR